MLAKIAITLKRRKSINAHGLKRKGGGFLTFFAQISGIGVNGVAKKIQREIPSFCILLRSD
jgi:hypothetical protein